MTQIVNTQYYGPHLPLSKELLSTELLINGIANFSHAEEVILHQIGMRCTRLALNNSLSFRPVRKMAVISGAGIAGLAAAFELRARDFNVVIVEKRKEFSRYNIINFNVEVERFLKRFDLLDGFQKDVAARIQTHGNVDFTKKGKTKVKFSDVSQLKFDDAAFELKNVNALFEKAGIYSARIKDLQTFLAEKALRIGVRIFGKVEAELLPSKKIGGRSKVRILGKESFGSPMTFKPQLFFVAEGAHSHTAKQLKMEVGVVEKECTNEYWVYGNASYLGSKTFVASVTDYSNKEDLRIANLIFNAKVHEINIAVSSKESLRSSEIEKRILSILKKAMYVAEIREKVMGAEEGMNALIDIEKIAPIPSSLIKFVKRPVHVKNERRLKFSKDNIFCIGDAAGNSSPLAGLGGTLCLTLVPRIIEQLLDDLERDPDHMHRNFEEFSSASILRWIEKSSSVKKHIPEVFKNALKS